MGEVMVQSNKFFMDHSSIWHLGFPLCASRNQGIGIFLFGNERFFGIFLTKGLKII